MASSFEATKANFRFSFDRLRRLERAMAVARTWIDCSGLPEKDQCLDALDRMVDGPLDADE